MHCSRCEATWEWPKASGVPGNRNTCPFCGNPLADAAAPNQEANRFRRSDPNDFVIDGSTLLYYNGSDSTVYVPEGVRVIGDGTYNQRMFKNSQAVREIVLPESVREIKEAAFQDCTALESINLPNTISSIGKGAFYYCRALKRVRLPSSMTVISESLFSGCISLEEVILPPALTKISASAFRNCSSLKTIVFPRTLTKIGHQAFLNCKKLDNVIIPDSVTSIEIYYLNSFCPIFEGCENLTHLVIPSLFPLRTVDSQIPFMRTRAAVEHNAKKRNYDLSQLENGYCPQCSIRMSGLFSMKCPKCGKSKDQLRLWVSKQ